MVHDKFRLTPEQISSQEERTFNWTLRKVEQLADNVIADIRLKPFFKSIRHWCKRLQKEHGASISKFEAIIGKWELDENFSSIILKWTSDRGTFMREFQLHKATRIQYILVAGKT